VTYLAVPVVSLAFVGLVQGAAVSASLPEPGGRRSDASRDFVAKGAGNIAAGLCQGMPIGGSMSASALLVNGAGRPTPGRRRSGPPSGGRTGDDGVTHGG
jgi:sulfate permease, SulP family